MLHTLVLFSFLFYRSFSIFLVVSIDAFAKNDWTARLLFRNWKGSLLHQPLSSHPHVAKHTLNELMNTRAFNEHTHRSTVQWESTWRCEHTYIHPHPHTYAHIHAHTYNRFSIPLPFITFRFQFLFFHFFFFFSTLHAAASLSDHVSCSLSLSVVPSLMPI